MKTTTLTNFQSDIRLRVDIASTSDRLSDAQLTRLINKSKDNLVAVVQSHGGGEWYWADADFIEMSANVDTINIPSSLNSGGPGDFHKLLKLAWIDSYTLAGDVAVPDSTARLYPLMRESVDGFANTTESNAGAWSAGNLPKYRIYGNIIKFSIEPTAAVGLYMLYQYIPSDLSAGGDTLTHGPSWDEWIVLDVCAKLDRRDGMDATPFLAERAAVEARIKSELAERDEWGLHQVRDTDSAVLSDRAFRDWVTHNV